MDCGRLGNFRHHTAVFFVRHNWQAGPAPDHPSYYGFAGCALAWQFAFIAIARDPIRSRIMMLPSVFEKFSFGASQTVLYLQHRQHASDLALGGIDTLLGVLFLVAYFLLSADRQSQT